MTQDPNNIKCQTCEKYGVMEYARYVRQEMSETEAAEFELHAHACSACLPAIHSVATQHQCKKEQEENELLYSRTLALMDRLDQDTFSIVVRAVKGVVELIRSTGQLLTMSPALAGIRSMGAAVSQALQPLRLVKEFAESQLSVEVTISPVEPDMLDVTVSLLDRKREEFISCALVSLVGESRMQDEITDENGQACFRVPAAGFYELVIKKNEQLLGTMTLNAM